MHMSRWPWLLVCLLLLTLSALGCGFSVSFDPGTTAPPVVSVNRLSATFLGQDGGSYAGR